MATPFDGLFHEGGVVNPIDLATILGAQPGGLPLQGSPVPPAPTGLQAAPVPMQMDTPVIPGLSLAPSGFQQADPNLPGALTVAPPASRGSDAAPGGLSWEAIERAIDNIESGGRADRIGRYDQLGPIITNPRSRYRGDRAYGRFQFMGRDIPALTEQFYGYRLTPQQFLENQEAQHAVFRGRFGQHMAQFGNPSDAAQAHFAGAGSVGAPGALDRNDAQAGFRGTSVRDYRRMFESGLSRYSAGPGQPGAGNGFTPTSLEVSPDFAAAIGSPTTSLPPPTPVSPRGAALAPGLAAAPVAGPPGAPQGPPVGGPMQLADAPTLPGNVARPGWMGILDQLGLATPGMAGTRPMPEGGFTPYGAWFDQMPVAQQQAAMAIYRRGQELQQQYPQATPQQIAQFLMRDPVFGRNAMHVGANGPAILQAAVQPPTGPPQIMAGPPGSQFFRNDAGVLSPTGQGVPPTAPTDIQVLQHLQSLPPAQRTEAMALLQQWRQATERRSDREQAWARLQQQDPATYTDEMRDRWLGGLIRPEPVTDNFGRVVGQRWVDTVTGRPVAMGPARSGVGGSSAPSVAPGTGAGGPPGTGVTPPASGQGAPGSINTEPRVIGRRVSDNREIIDIPDLSLQTTTLGNPAYMTLGAGPVSSFLGAWGRVVGNLIPGSEEEVLARQSALQQFRSAYATYRRGTRLAGEHEEAMSEIPSPGQIFTNPLESVNKLIGVREGLIRELQLARQQTADQSLDESTRKTASNRVADIQGLLLRLPSAQSMYELADQLRQGARIAGINLSEVGGRIMDAPSVAGDTASAVAGTGGPRPPTALPQDLSALGLPELRRLSLRQNLSQPDRQRLIEALRALETGRPVVPRSY